jgi:flavin reductase (DIM6/NTAB) family NADH-FMN oxidoreductase RutF
VIGAMVGGQVFWSVAQRFSTGVSVVTVGSGDHARGATVSAFCLLSKEPALVSVCLRRGSAALSLIRSTGCFTVNVLAGDQTRLARHFADRRRGHDQFDGLEWTPGEGAVPILAGTVCWFHCRAKEIVPAGDHDLVLAEVASLGQDRTRTPLLYFAGALHPGAIQIEE